MSETTTPQVSLQGKIHDAHPTRTVRRHDGVKVPAPLCGQRSNRFYPHVIRWEPGMERDTNCEKCAQVAG